MAKHLQDDTFNIFQVKNIKNNTVPQLVDLTIEYLIHRPIIYPFMCLTVLSVYYSCLLSLLTIKSGISIIKTLVFS
jgi:hypothetical protein